MIMTDADMRAYPRTTRYFKTGFRKDVESEHYARMFWRFFRMKRSLYSYLWTWDKGPVMTIVFDPASTDPAQFSIAEDVVRRFEGGRDQFIPGSGALQGRRIHLLTAHTLSRMVQWQCYAGNGSDGVDDAEVFDRDLFGDTSVSLPGDDERRIR